MKKNTDRLIVGFLTEYNVHEEIRELERKHGILCEKWGCHQYKILLPHLPGAKTIVQREKVNDSQFKTLNCYYQSGVNTRGDYCYFHGQGISVVGHGT